MCTAISFRSGDTYFGRNLDLHHSYQESITITPRKFPLFFKNGRLIDSHYAMIGMATVSKGYPLYYEATNEKGLSLAGLNFPDNAYYYSKHSDKNNIAPFELIPWLLGKCSNVAEAKQVLENTNLWNIPFSDQLPLSPLHWLLSDNESSLTLEPTEDGLKIYDNPIGVLTNNPPFPYHLHNLTNYMSLTPDVPINRQPIPLAPYSLGLGSFGLPGDMSSPSRFVKAAFTKLHSICDYSQDQSISQFFHILSSVCQQRGLTKLEDGQYEYTLYSSCCNTSKGIYYYTTYDNSYIHAVHLHHEELDSSALIRYPVIRNTHIKDQN